jgi:hypothetical protein
VSEKLEKGRSKALQSVLSCHQEQLSNCPEDAKQFIDQKLLEEILSAGLAFQFEDAPQKIKQNIRMQIRARIRKKEESDS